MNPHPRALRTRLLALALLSLPCAARQEGAAAERVALLVGIGRYAPGTPEPFADLQGPVEDVAQVRELLVGRFGFRPEDVRVLIDGEATHEGIVRAFQRDLIERAGEGTEAVFWFAGHGSRVPDRSGDPTAEADRMDSTYLAWDSRAGGRRGEYDLTDDELGSLLFALARRTRRITVVTDSCHSGGGVRGLRSGRARTGPAGERAFAREAVAAFWPEDVEFLDDDDPRPLAADAYVHVAACGPRQLAYEDDFELLDGSARGRGVLSFFLIEELRRCAPEATWRQVTDRVSLSVTTRSPDQTPWRSGALDREVFGGRFRPPPAGFSAAAVGARDLVVDAGTLHLVRSRSLLEILDAGSERSLGAARVTRAGAARSLARWVDPPPDLDRATPLLAVLRSRPPLSEPLRVRCSEPSLAELLEGCEHAVPAREGERGVHLLERAEDGAGLRLSDPEGIPIRTFDPPGPSAGGAGEHRNGLRGAIDEELRQELVWRELFALALEPGELRLEARFSPPREEDYQRLGRPALPGSDVAPSAGEGSRAAGREYSAAAEPGGGPSLAVLEVRNASAEELYVTVLSIAEDRSRRVIHPYGERGLMPLPPGATVAVPCGIVLPASWPLDRPMRDRYLAIATRSRADFQGLERGRALRAAPDGLPGPVALALAAGATRGPSGPGGPAWGVVAADVLVSAADR